MSGKSAITRFKDWLSGKHTGKPVTIDTRDDLVSPGLPDKNLPLVVMPHRQSHVSRPIDPGPHPLKTWRFEPEPRPEPPFENVLDLLDAAAHPPLLTARLGQEFRDNVLKDLVIKIDKSKKARKVTSGHGLPSAWHGSRQNTQSIGITLHQTAIKRRKGR